MTSLSNGQLGRRAMLSGLVTVAGVGRGLAGELPGDDATRATWSMFKTRFISQDGRVIDNDNHGVSHSEGQGYGMVFAEHFGDLATFERLRDWTGRVLRRTPDALHAWRYIPDAAVPVADLNNATDGDLFIAYALSRAGRRWHRPDFTIEAEAIATDILRLLVRRVANRVMLMPGVKGFDLGHAVIINPSYYAFFMFDELNRAAPSRLWAGLRADGLSLLDDARFGRWRLPPDWLCVSKIDGGMAPAPARPSRFSFDAVRIPLHLAWSRNSGSDAAQSIAAYWAGTGGAVTPAWIDLVTNETAPYAASPGVMAVRNLALAASGRPLPVPTATALPLTYYAASLMLLAEIARACNCEIAGGPASRDRT